MEFKDLIGLEIELDGSTSRILESKLEDSNTIITLKVKKLEAPAKNKLGTRSRKNLIGIHPDLVRLMEEAVKNQPLQQ